MKCLIYSKSSKNLSLFFFFFSCLTVIGTGKGSRFPEGNLDCVRYRRGREETVP